MSGDVRLCVRLWVRGGRKGRDAGREVEMWMRGVRLPSGVHARLVIVPQEVIQLVALLLLHEAVEVVHRHATVATLVGVVQHRLR